VLFSQVSSTGAYFTGIAVVNPNTSPADVSIELHGSDGALVATKQEVIPAGSRVSRLLTEYFPALAGKNQSSGYVRVIANRPITAYSTVGTKDLSALSAID
jgi:hypothetical protein